MNLFAESFIEFEQILNETVQLREIERVKQLEIFHAKQTVLRCDIAEELRKQKELNKNV